MKLKHNAGSKTEREKLAKSLVWAYQNGGQIQDLPNINLPPGTIERAAKNLGIDLHADEWDQRPAASRGKKNLQQSEDQFPAPEKIGTTPLGENKNTINNSRDNHSAK
jgi:hypothetical protein